MGHAASGPSVLYGMEGAVAGSDRAVAQARVDAMVREYQTKLARYLRRMVGDAEVALDLTQDVFLAAYRMLDADPAREVNASWLYRVATNGAISYMRRRKLVRMLSLDRDLEGSSFELHGGDWRIDERSAASVDLQAALSRLAPEQAAAVLLTSYAGYSSQEAAEMLSTTADAVRQRVCRAMRVLRAVMMEKG